MQIIHITFQKIDEFVGHIEILLMALCKPDFITDLCGWKLKLPHVDGSLPVKYEMVYGIHKKYIFDTL